MFFLVPNLTPRPVQNLLPSKLPRTGNSIQICSFLRILNPTILAFSLKFHQRGQIKFLLPSKLPIFSTVQPTDVFFLARNFTPRPIQNLLPSKLPRTVNSIQICSFLRILNPTILSFSLKFHLRGQIKILLPPNCPFSLMFFFWLAVSVSTSSKFVAFKIATNDTFHSKFSMFAYFKPNYSFFFIEISLM
jgi:hypothetical protein